MFPFSTDKYQGFTRLSFDEFITRLENNIFKKSLHKPDGNFYGKIDIGFSTFELGIKPERDASRPVVVLKWNKSTGKILVQTKCRLNYSVHMIILLWLTFGIYLVIQDKDIKSIIPILLFSIFSYLMLYILYSKQKFKTLKKLTELFNDLEIEETKL
ncbi:MAG: hypothetical protein IPI46_13330 [Bacteroidetes bacterium]|nr:hypothetical protein [Bacteroidota bacterium]